jgi:hypothetical protein
VGCTLCSAHVCGPRRDRSVALAPDTTAPSSVYRAFLGQFLPEFQHFLQREALLERSFFHLSDEPPGEAHLASYRDARELLRELAPWMQIMDALTDREFARSALMDIPVPLLTTAPAFVDAGFPAWAYFCCIPRGRYLNRFLDTPLVKVRMAGWLFYRAHSLDRCKQSAGRSAVNTARRFRLRFAMISLGSPFHDHQDAGMLDSQQNDQVFFHFLA